MNEVLAAPPAASRRRAIAVLVSVALAALALDQGIAALLHRDAGDPRIRVALAWRATVQASPDPDALWSMRDPWGQHWLRSSVGDAYSAGPDGVDDQGAGDDVSAAMAGPSAPTTARVLLHQRARPLAAAGVALAGVTALILLRLRPASRRGEVARALALSLPAALYASGLAALVVEAFDLRPIDALHGWPRPVVVFSSVGGAVLVGGLALRLGVARDQEGEPAP